MTYHLDAATSTVFATLSFVTMVGITLTLVFETLRGKLGDLYLPRLRSQGHRTLSPPPPEPFQWMRYVWMVSDEDFLQSVGMDGYVLLRFLRLICKVTILCGITGLIILVPVYFSCPGNDGVAGINLYTMANVEQRGHALWAPFIFTWMFTLLLLYLLYQEYGAFAHFRQLFLQHGDEDNLRPQTRYSVLVENIPVEYRSTEKLFAFFDNLFPNEIAYARISVGMKPLSKVIIARDEMVAKAELAIAEYEASGRTARPTIKLLKGVPVSSSCKCGSAAEEVDAMEYYETRIAALNVKVARYQQEAKAAEGADVLPPDTIISEEDIEASSDEERVDSVGSDNRKDNVNPKITKKSVGGTGFVTFKSRRAQATACQVAILSQKYPLLKIFRAPEPSDIVWSNITVSLQYTKESERVTAVMYYTGIGFWGVVLAFIATISNLATLDDYIPFISSLDPVLYAVLAGVLPVLTLVLFMSYLPVFMGWVSEFVERRKTRSEISMEVFGWNFLYQITNVYLLMLAGSVATSISDLIDDPSSILSTLGAALPAISVFFINLSLNYLFLEIPLQMLRIVPLALIKFYYYAFDEKKLTRRLLVEGPLAKEAVEYGSELPHLLYLVCIVVTYWTIAPILTAILALVFVRHTIMWKYMLLYVYVPNYESGGVYWYGLYKYTMYALVASNLTMIAYMGLKEGPTQAALLLPLLYIIFRAWGYTEDRYKEVSLYFAFSTAVEADYPAAPGAETSKSAISTFHPDYYKQPWFSAPTVAHLQPYRIDGVPLWTKKGNFSREYYDEMPGTRSDEECGLVSKGSENIQAYEPPSVVATENPLIEKVIN